MLNFLSTDKQIVRRFKDNAERPAVAAGSDGIMVVFSKLELV